MLFVFFSIVYFLEQHLVLLPKVFLVQANVAAESIAALSEWKYFQISFGWRNIWKWEIRVYIRPSYSDIENDFELHKLLSKTQRLVEYTCLWSFQIKCLPIMSLQQDEFCLFIRFLSNDVYSLFADIIYLIFDFNFYYRT